MISKLQEKMNSYQRVWAEIDLDAIWENMIHMKENIAPETKILAVIKTDGYGHGGVPIARMLEDVDFMFGYAAATYEEAHVLREAGVKKPILILGYTFPYCYEEMIREEIRPAVYRRDTVEELAEAAAKAGKKAKVHIKVDTGMGRIGITPDDEGLDFVKFVMEHPGLEVEGIFTHFAKSDEADKTSANHQLELFQNFIDRIQSELGLEIPVKHCSNSAAILEMLTSYDQKDSTSVKRTDCDFTSALVDDVKGMRIGIPSDYLSAGLDEEVKAAILKAADVLKQKGAIVEEFQLSLVEYAIPAYYVIASAEASSNLARFDGVKYGYRAKEYNGLHGMYKKSRSEGFGEEVKRRIMLGSFVLSSGYYDAYYLKALRTKALIKQSFDRAFEKYDVILGPVAPMTAPKLGESLLDPLKMYLGDIYTISVNLAGLPGVSVPCGVDSKGLPIGVQLIGDCFKEKNIIRAAYAYEQARGKWQAPPCTAAASGKVVE